MSNQIERDAFVKRDVLKNPIPYTRGTDLLPIVIHFRDFQIPSGATARVFVAKADGNAVYTTATIDGNDVTVDVTDQMFIELGMALMQISIMDGEEELVSFVQPVDVKQNLKAGDFTESITDVSFLDDAIEQANEAVNTATAAAQQAATAVQNANQAIEDANEAISDLNAQIASLNTNFASLANNVSISQLDTTAKTLVGAIDELNSKSYLLRGGMQIPSGADMDNYKTPGNYFAASNNVANTLSNAPFTSAFTMKVEYSQGTGYPCQTFREYGRGNMAFRLYDTGAGSPYWTQYYYFSDDDTMLTSVQVDSLQTSNKNVVSAINEIGGNATQGDVISAFNEIKDNLWATWDIGLINTSVSISGPALYVLGYKTNNDYGSIIIMSYFANRPAYAYVNNATWYGPKNI